TEFPSTGERYGQGQGGNALTRGTRGGNNRDRSGHYQVTNIRLKLRIFLREKLTNGDCLIPGGRWLRRIGRWWGKSRGNPDWCRGNEFLEGLARPTLGEPVGRIPLGGQVREFEPLERGRDTHE